MHRFLSPALRLLCCTLSLTAVTAQAGTRLHEAAQAVRIVQQIDSANLVTLKGNVHPLAQARYDTGVVSKDLPMERMLLVLKPTDDQQAAMRELIDAQHTRDSYQFHKWISADEFGAKFGAAPADVNALRSWLQTEGFDVRSVAHNNRVIEFSGTAGQVAKTFHTEIHSFMVGGEQHYANAGDPRIPSALAGVVAGVASLHNFHAKSSAHVTEHGMTKLQAGQQHPELTYTNSKNQVMHAMVPGDFHTIYNEGPTLATNVGSGVTIAVIARTDIVSSDFRAFQSLFLSNYATGTLNIINNGIDPGIADPGDQEESTLDAEWAEATAPSATIDLIVSAATNATDGVVLSQLYAVDLNHFPIMTSSFGLCEVFTGDAGNQLNEIINAQAAAEGTTAIVSAGDNGSAGCDDQNASGDASNPTLAQYGLQVSGTASTPWNIAVGGNEFQDGNGALYWGSQNGKDLSSALGYIPEGVWNESCAPGQCPAGDENLFAGSGGVSSCIQSTSTQTANGTNIQCKAGYAKPSWQANGIAGMPNDHARDLPDLSLTAAGHDGYFICVNGSCTPDANGNIGINTVGGTSASAPSFAGIMALVNSVTGTKLGEGQANYVLYPLFKAQGSVPACTSGTVAVTGTNQCVFYDVVSGTNAVPCAGGSANCSATQQGTVGVLSGYNAGTGYDPATGLGSLNVTNLVNKWTSVKFNGSQTSITVSPTSIVHGSPVNTTINVTPLAGSGPAATGVVSLLTTESIATNQGVAVFPLANGTASGNFAGLPGGTYQIYAQYSGDAVYGGSQSPLSSGNVTVTPEPSKTTLTLTTVDSHGNLIPVSGPLGYGAPLFVDVSVAGQSGQGTATGTANVTIDGKTAGNPLALNTTGALEVNASFTPGAHTIAAAYGGDLSFNASKSAGVSITAVKGATQTALQSDVATVPVGGTVSLTAVLTPPANGALQTGTVTLMDGATILGQPIAVQTATNQSGTQLSVAVATLTSAQLNHGTNNLTAIYSGDTNYNGSTSVPLAVSNVGGTVQASIALTAAAAAGVPAGTPATSLVNITPAGGFSGPVNLSCTVANPAGVTPAAGDQPVCSLAPSINLAANTAAATTLTVTSVARPTAVSSSNSPANHLVPLRWWLAGGGGSGLACIFFFGLPVRRSRYLLGLCCLLIGLGGIGCGSGSSNNGGSTPTPAPPAPANAGTPAGAYVVTVNAVSAATATITSSATVTVNIQ